jgi:hypothetical protein
MPGNWFAIHQRLQRAGLIFAHTAQTPAAVLYHATMAAQIAFDFITVQRFIQVSFH